MQKFIISLICCFLPVLAFAEAPEIRDNAPDKHVVVKGDTLWDISEEFFKDPWRWPQIWGLNKDSIKDPHWIYPGDVIYLDRATGTLHIGEPVEAKTEGGSPNETTIKLSPRVRGETSAHDAIPSIPLADIEPFITRPVILGPEGFAGAPTLVGAYEQRVLIGTGDTAYVKDMPKDKGASWQVYRPGKQLIDPVTGKVLGQEAIYVGDVKVEKFAAPLSTIKVTREVQEMARGDRLYQPSGTEGLYIVPHAPSASISARIISIYGGLTQAGQNTVVTINKGARDGLENGHVLALYHKGQKDGKFILPDVRYGLLFIYRVYDKVAYGLVMQSTLPAEILDRAQTP